MRSDRLTLSAGQVREAFVRRLAVPMVVASTIALGACAGAQSPLDFAGLGTAKPAQTAAAEMPQSDLQKATEYWGKQFEKSPGDPQTAINYARNLKALGAKQQAMGVLQQAHTVSPQHKGVASEYGRLALEAEELPLAEKLLAIADDPVRPDWKIMSARGAVLAKQGRYRESIPMFERALALAPNQPSVMNNLALAHAMNGQAEKAEPLLRQASADANADPKVVQNLSLVLGLQGKHEDAKSVVVRNMSDNDVAEDSRYVREMVGTQTAAAAPAWSAPKTAPIATSSTGAAKAKGKSQAQPVAQAEDPAAAVQRLADGYTATPTDAPVQLGPKP